MRYFDNNNSTNLLSNEHIMLLYEDRNNRNNFIIDIINEGLKNGCLCIYAAVDIDNSKSISLIDNLSSRIINYEENIQNENLKFINSKPYYESALKGDLTVFEKWKSELEYALYNRLSEGKKDKILIVGDVSCTLYETRNFNECIDLERWWQDVHSDWIKNNKDITVVCPHPNYVFKEESEQIIKNKISNSHNATINIENESSFQYFYNLIAKNSNFDDLVNYQQTIKKTMKEIKYNFMEEHKNIINTYYSIFSKQLDDIIDDNFNNPKTMEEYSNTYSEINRNLMDNQTNTTRIINDIMDKNMDTFLKSIEVVHKFYCDVVQSYYNYIMTIKKSSEK
ncbi:MAG TPA: MEDS domain-containing protein [Nitrososphaeraceae archaeon]|nr:MEDS domain-containing protein [Nitrososphaeraceae archaeon]